MSSTPYAPLLLKIKSGKTAADTFRANPDFKVDQAITELAVGEALISCLDQQGTPQIVQRGWVMPPYSSFSPLSDEERQALMAQSLVAGVYEKMVDRDSAYEMLQQKSVIGEQEQAQAEAAQQAKQQEALAKQQAKEQERLAREQQKPMKKLSVTVTN